MVKAPTGEQGYAANRVCEFFAIDKNEAFQIWNLQQNKKGPAKKIEFSEKHASDDEHKTYRISNTCPDQSFFTAFVLGDFSVKMYLMNFKKGGTITKKKLVKENAQSVNLIKALPSNGMSLASTEEQIRSYL